MIIPQAGLAAPDLKVYHLRHLLDTIRKVYHTVVEFSFKLFIKVGLEFLCQIFQPVFQGCFSAEY